MIGAIVAVVAGGCESVVPALTISKIIRVEQTRGD
jgi:hypothetical protein